MTTCRWSRSGVTSWIMGCHSIGKAVVADHLYRFCCKSLPGAAISQSTTGQNSSDTDSLPAAYVGARPCHMKFTLTDVAIDCGAAGCRRRPSLSLATAQFLHRSLSAPITVCLHRSLCAASCLHRSLTIPTGCPCHRRSFDIPVPITNP
jgi:hypothetical protein